MIPQTRNLVELLIGGYRPSICAGEGRLALLSCNLRGDCAQHRHRVAESNHRTGLFRPIILSEGNPLSLAAKLRQSGEGLRAAERSRRLVNCGDDASLTSFDGAEAAVADGDPLPSVF